MPDDDAVLLRQPFDIDCASTLEARNLHAAFPDITRLAGMKVSFTRSIRIREAKTIVKTAPRPRK